ncbi:MAG: DNA mismatch repair protein MutS, partial [Firmicutes bacterium]|nr:DNA mismatch repair protein MutS [Bacillota bacterium]
NTVERIAASKALLRYTAMQNALCIAATHDIELTKLLPDYRQVHFREEITPQGMVFPYRLLEGVSDTRNAIRLLEQMGFPAEVIADADAMAESE